MRKAIYLLGAFNIKLGGGHMKIEAILRIILHICTVIINIVNIIIIVIEITKK